ncbi:MAG: response regulator [Spirochaetales bacterium]|nr:response regulator [Spirochaetales bacterium]
MIRISDYLNLAAQDSSCHSIEIYDGFSHNIILRVEGTEPLGLSRLLERLGIIAQRLYETPIIYENQVIGELRLVRYHRVIYLKFISFLILILIFLIIILIENLTNTRNELESKVLERTEDLKVILDSIGDGVVMTDREGRLLAMNPTAEGISGWTEEESRGKDIGEIFPLAGDGPKENLEHTVQRIINSGEKISFTPQSLLISRSGKMIRISESGAPVYSAERKIIGAVIVIKEISEEYELQRKLQQNRKMEALGQMAGGIAHDFNNLLAGIVGASDLIALAAKDDENISGLNSLVLETAQRAGSLIKKLLTFAREKPPLVDQVEVNGILVESVDMLRRTINKNITITSDLWDKPLFVQGDITLLQNVIMNLCINSSHAMPEGGDLILRTRQVELGEEYCRLSFFDLEKGAFCELIVEDTGVGIPHKNLEKIFDPFFTTKEPGKGTGLGLSAAYGTVRQYKGEIKVYSEKDRGTRFNILLPLSGEKAKANGEIPKDYIRGKGTILVVDDEESIRKTTGSLLEFLGYQVITAKDGREGLDKLTPQVDGVSLDMIMPVMDGKACFHELKKLRPDLPIIIASGFSHDRGWSDLAENRADGFLLKPFKGIELSHVLNDILNSREEKHEK